MYAYTYITCWLLVVGCYCGIMRTRPKLLETALRQYIVREAGVDLIRVGEIEVRVLAFVFHLVCFIVVFRVLFSSFFSTLRGHLGINRRAQ